MNSVWRGALALISAIVLAACVSTPRNDRTWYPYLARTTHVEIEAQHFSVAPVTDWTYDRTGPIVQNYTDADLAFADLRNIWFVLEPQPGSHLAAHTFLLFEFGGDRLVGITIEARREANEDYSAIRGAFNAYELSYLWGAARDLLTRRAVMLNHQVFVYPIVVTDAQRRDVLRHLLMRTQDLETHPRWYNTFTSNCTNELAKATNLRWDVSFILTGLSAQHLYDLHLIPGANFADVRRRADVSQFVRDLNTRNLDDGAFDRALMTELRSRGLYQ